MHHVLKRTCFLAKFQKVNQGVSYLITQTLFDNQAFYDFRERLQFAQVDVPIEVGIMPCTNLNQIKKITELSGNPMPKKFVDIMDHFRNNQEAMRDAGINYAIEQIVDLLSNNADGIHLYTMNNVENVQQIWDATHTLFAETSNHPTERV
ncbi:methylenetetrahydrofolate reductase [Fructilactobacillus sanfranciscensis]|uniref:methylenetetrahydrofolate reductase n=1 Tax=Fructilactobacillus sanfranciscensis TaxID=1625 RepID=UPI000CD3FDA9|nr:methylenetetrahydrofolate reductase [Fructilactobacillus sanfranciscensis]